MTVRLTILLALFLTGITSKGQAQDQEESLLGKEGLIIGIGLGGGYLSTTTRTTQFGETSETTVDNLAVTGDFKFGAGLSDKVLLYWFGKSGFFNGEDSFGVGTQTSTIVALSGVGASYYLGRRISISGGVGVTSLTSNRQTAWGPGFVVGGEYEFARHWLIDLDFLFGQPQPDELPGIDRTTNTFLVKATLNWLYY
jgi:hypothetical protein